MTVKVFYSDVQDQKKMLMEMTKKEMNHKALNGTMLMVLKKSEK
jgi:hypothetical protein